MVCLKRICVVWRDAVREVSRLADGGQVSYCNGQDLWVKRNMFVQSTGRKPSLVLFCPLKRFSTFLISPNRHWTDHTLGNRPTVRRVRFPIGEKENREGPFTYKTRTWPERSTSVSEFTLGFRFDCYSTPWCKGPDRSADRRLSDPVYRRT